VAHPARIVAALLLLLTACSEPAPRAWRGAVVDALDGHPVAGARVASAGAIVTTDPAGRFTLPAGAAEVRVVAPGYLDLRRLDRRESRFALWPASPSDAAVDAHLARLERARVLRDDPDDPALSASARARLRGEPLPDVGGDVGAVRAALDAPPASIRIWRRSIDGAASSCDGRIDEIPLEEYVAGVLPHEWIPSWSDDSLRAGSLAIRTYAWQWVRAGGKYDCADLDDTARSQVYRDDRTERASAAVMATAGMAITVDGALVSGEYSAENGNPTAMGVEDPLCDGFEIRGHRRGMCQWGSQRWSLDGRDHLWIAAHYYPGSIVEGGAPAADDYDARFVALDAPATLRSGERAEVVFELENVGRREWTAEGTRLATSDGGACPFYDEVAWLDDATATGPDAYRYAPGESGTFTVTITAPHVDEAMDVVAPLRLLHDGVGGFGPTFDLGIHVEPTSGPPPVPGHDAGATTDPDGGAGGPPREMDGGGCAAAPGGGPLGPLGLVAIALVWRRRRS